MAGMEQPNWPAISREAIVVFCVCYTYFGLVMDLVSLLAKNGM
jgi:hypothetical protein